MTLIPLLLSSLLATASTPSSNLVISPCDAGDHYQFEIVKCSIELRNTGTIPITISEGEARFPWDRIESGRIVVPAGGTGYIEATVDLRDDEGVTTHAFRFATDEPGQAHRGSHVRAYASSVLDQHNPEFDFGVVKLGVGDLPSAIVSLSSRDTDNFRITAIESKPDWLDASLGTDGHTVNAKLRDTVPWGLIHQGSSFVKLKINSPHQSSAWIEINAEVMGDVVPDGNPFSFGMLRTVGKHEFLLRITSRSGKDFKVGKLSVERIKATAKAEQCIPPARGCRLLRIDVANDQPTGKLEGVLNVELPGYGKTLPIELVGLLLTPETKIHQMDELLERSTTASGGMSAAAKPADLGKAIEATIKKEVPPPPGKGPLLRWSVAHQQPIYGYAIYRADKEQGPFLQVNDDIIHVIESDDENSGAYQWRDDSAKSGKTYWYKVGILNRDGSKKDLTAAQKVIAK